MNRYILLLMLFYMFAASAEGAPQNEQTNNHKVSHPLIEFSKKYMINDIGANQSMFKSNESLNIESIEYQGYNGSEFMTSFKTDFIYQAGYRTETRYYSKVDQTLELDSREVYEYGEEKLISLTNQLAYGEEFENDYRTTFTYQQTGGKVYLNETLYQIWSTGSSDWENDERMEFTVSDGALTGGESSLWDGTQWGPYERFILEEQESNLYLIYQDYTGSEWVNSDRQIYDNFSIDELYSIFSEEINAIDTGSLLVFAELLPDYTEQMWDGNGWVDTSRQVTETEYIWGTGQIAGKVITGQIYDAEWVTNTEVRITYQDGKPSDLILNTIDESETPELVAVYAEEFQYDDQGLLKYVIEKYPVGETMKATSGTELVIIGRSVLEWSGAPTSVEDGAKPYTFSLGNAYPNPFNPSTVIPFQLGRSGEISIRVFDMLGRDVITLANGIYPAGNHTVRFDASGLSSGMYLIRLDAPEYRETRRVTLLK